MNVKSRKQQYLIGLSAALGLILVLGLVKFFQVRAIMAEMSGRSMPPDAVTSVVVKEEVWPQRLTAVATLTAMQGTILGTEAAGRVSAIRFQNGEAVKKGQILIELDTQVEEAQLKGAIAQADLSRLVLDRAQRLRERNVNSVAELDQAEAQHRNNIAEVETLKAQIAKKKVIAPFDGVAGIREVNEGQIVSTGANVVSLYSLDSLFVDFDVPQKLIGQLRTGLPVRFTVDAFGAETFSGTVTAIDPNVDPETRNIAVQATTKNPERRLMPGMFARATVTLPQEERYLTIPTTAIQYAPYGDMVYVIEEMTNEKGEKYRGVRQQRVTIADSEGDLEAISSGLNAGDEIVTSGIFKLRPGAAVVVNNSVQPGAERNPTPRES